MLGGYTLTDRSAWVLSPGQGPGLVLSPPDPDGVLGAARYLRLDRIVTTRFVEADAATYLVGAAFDVHKGSMQASGVVHLVNAAPPPGGIDALADYLLTGEAGKGPVRRYDPDRQDWKVPSPLLGPAPRRPTATRGWVAFGAGVSAVVLTGVSIWQAASARSSYDDARKLLGPGGAAPSAADRPRYDSLNRRGDSAKRTALITGVGAGACLAGSVVLGYLSYKQTGEVGPFRF